MNWKILNSKRGVLRHTLNDYHSHQVILYRQKCMQKYLFKVNSQMEYIYYIRPLILDSQDLRLV